MVSNTAQALVLNENHTFSQNEINILTNHEIGVHMVTTFNAINQPLKIFSHGFPNYEETQEGLAVFSEYMSNNLTITRLKELAYRVIAVDTLAKGYPFSRTFRGKLQAFKTRCQMHVFRYLTKRPRINLLFRFCRVQTFSTYPSVFI